MHNYNALCVFRTAISAYSGFAYICAIVRYTYKVLGDDNA